MENNLIGNKSHFSETYQMLIPWPPRKSLSVSKCSFCHHESVIEFSHPQMIFLQYWCPASAFFYCLENYTSLIWCFRSIFLCQFWDTDFWHTFLSLFILVAAFVRSSMDLYKGSRNMPLSEISFSNSFALFCCKHFSLNTKLWIYSTVLFFYHFNIDIPEAHMHRIDN